MKFDRNVTIIGVGLTFLALTACGGGGGGAAAVTHTSPVTVATNAPGTGTGQATFRIDTGAPATSATARTGQFVSPSTASATISLQGATTPIATINITPTTAGCTTTATGATQCVITLAVPAGQQSFTIATYDAANGAGHLLSTAAVTFTIVQNATNTIAIVLNGVVATAKVVLATTSVVAGTAAVIPVTVAAYDAAGNIIVGPGMYSTPITLTNSDTSGVTTLSATQITGPGSTNVALSYNGQSVNAATITPSINNAAGSAAIFSPGGYGIAQIELPASFGAGEALATGADGNLWIAAQNTIGYTSTTGTSMQVFGTGNGLPTGNYYALAAGSDGNMWFGTSGGDIGSITESGAVTTLASITVPANCTQAGGGQTFASVRKVDGSRLPQGGPSPSPGPSTVACGFINAMVLGPDGNLWFADDDGFIGKVGPNHVATEYDITALPSWPSGTGFDPEALTFGSDGTLYVGNYDDGMEQITIAGGVPTVVNHIDGGCGTGAVAIGPDSNLYATDDCANLMIVPLTSFATTNVQFFDIGALTGPLYWLVASPGGIFGTNDDNGTVMRISNFAATGAPASPAYNLLFPFTSQPDGRPVTVGPDHNIWAANGSNGTNDELAKIVYGGANVGTQSAKRLPRAAAGLRRAIKNKHRPHTWGV
jgi:streptogramin lyase